MFFRFYALSYILKHRQDIFFHVQHKKTLKGIIRLFFSNFFQISFFGEKFIPSQLYLSVKGLIFVILCRSFLISSYFNATVTVSWRYLFFFIDGIYCIAFLFLYPIESISK